LKPTAVASMTVYPAMLMPVATAAPTAGNAERDRRPPSRARLSRPIEITTIPSSCSAGRSWPSAISITATTHGAVPRAIG
jgi:hypothetical protein